MTRTALDASYEDPKGPTMANPLHHPGSDNSDTARYQRGLQAYSSQFHITPEQVPAWFADAVGDRFAKEGRRSRRSRRGSTRPWLLPDRGDRIGPGVWR